MTLQQSVSTLSCFQTALAELAKSNLVHSLILSSTSSSVYIFFFSLSLCPVELSLLCQKILRRSQITFLDKGRKLITFFNGYLDLSGTSSLEAWSLYEMFNILREASHLKGLCFFSKFAVKVHDSQAYRNAE